MWVTFFHSYVISCYWLLHDNSDYVIRFVLYFNVCIPHHGSQNLQLWLRWYPAYVRFGADSRCAGLFIRDTVWSSFNWPTDISRSLRDQISIVRNVRAVIWRTPSDIFIAVRFDWQWWPVVLGSMGYFYTLNIWMNACFRSAKL